MLTMLLMNVLVAAAPEQPSVKVLPRKEAILSGEPLVVDVVLENTAPSPITVDLGADGVEAFRFVLKDPGGRTVCSSDSLRLEGTRASGKVRVEPGGKETTSVVMNRWCSTELDDGRYEATVYVKTTGNTHRPPDAIALDQMATFSFTVKTEDAATLTQVFDDLRRSIVSGRENNASHNLKSEMLFSTRSPSAVKPLVNIVSDSEDRRLRARAIKTLGAIPTAASAKTLGEVALSETEADPEWPIKRLAINAVHQVRESSENPDVERATREVARKYPKRPFDQPLD